MLFTGIGFVFSQTELNDKDIGDAIESKYEYDHAVNANAIDVSVTDGIVELTGTVTNIKARERAGKLARLVKGVRTVSNRIEVKPPFYLSDQEIASKVENALLMDPATDSYEVSVSVKENVVTLTGEVDSFQEKELCAAVAKSVTGVKDLKNDIKVDYDTDRTDAEIRNEIRQTLKWDATVDDGLIEVSVDDGNVKLTGAVGSAAEKSNAYLAAWVAGVNSVDQSGLDVQWWAEDEDLRKYKFVPKSDEEIKEAINLATFYDPRVSVFNITAEVDQGWVTLRGKVDNLKAKKAAGMLAEHTTGVIGVDNMIKVRDTENVRKDEQIKTDIKAALSDNAVTEAWEIDVTVNNGTATLTGVVDSYLEKQEAEWVASGVRGVTDVNNTLTINYPYGYFWWDPYPYYDLYMVPPDPMTTPTVYYLSDEEIKENVESELWWSPFVDRDQINLEVSNGVVTISGTVDSWREYNKAAENAWEGGAMAVVNNLKVK